MEVVMISTLKSTGGYTDIPWKNAASFATALIFMFWMFAYVPALFITVLTLPEVPLLFSSLETWPPFISNIGPKDSVELLNWCLSFSYPKWVLLVLQTSLVWTTLIHFLLLTIHEWLAKALNTGSFSQDLPTSLPAIIALKLRIIPKR
jgi:hypothetical protein